MRLLAGFPRSLNQPSHGIGRATRSTHAKQQFTSPYVTSWQLVGCTGQPAVRVCVLQAVAKLGRGAQASWRRASWQIDAAVPQGSSQPIGGSVITCKVCLPPLDFAAARYDAEPPYRLEAALKAYEQIWRCQLAS